MLIAFLITSCIIVLNLIAFMFSMIFDFPIAVDYIIITIFGVSLVTFFVLGMGITISYLPLG